MLCYKMVSSYIVLTVHEAEDSSTVFWAQWMDEKPEKTRGLRGRHTIFSPKLADSNVTHNRTV